MKMTNYRISTEPKTTMYKAEAEAICAVVVDTFDNITATTGKSFNEGSYLLYGKKDGGDKIQKIISFDFGNGPTNNFHVEYGLEPKTINSHDMAEIILLRSLSKPQEDATGYISYYIDSPLFLVLKTTHGLFCCACFSRFFSYETMKCAYSATAQAIACMGLEDKVLQESCEEIFCREREDVKKMNNVRARVVELYAACEIKKLKQWKEWHDRANSELPLYFG